MTLVKTVVVLAAAGVVLWGTNTYIPASPAVKAIVTVAIMLLLCLWLLQTFGVIDGIRGYRAR
jgi:hypothetical protein